MSFGTGIAVGLCFAAGALGSDPAPLGGRPVPVRPDSVTTIGVERETGRLVRVPVRRLSRPVTARTVAPQVVADRVVSPRQVTPQPVEPQPPAAYNVVAPRTFDQLIDQLAYRYGIRPSFVRAVIKAESNYNPTAISPKGALGLMQLMPLTARRYGVGNVFDPAENVTAGVRHLRHLLDLYDNPGLSLAAYNAGEGAVERYRGVPPYRETVQFVRRVNHYYNLYRAQEKPAAEPAPRKQDGSPIYRPIYRMLEASGFTRYTTQAN